MNNTVETFASVFESGCYTLRPDAVFVTMLPKVEQTTKSGLIMPTSEKGIEGYKADTPIFVEVVQTGGDGPFQVGNILLTPPLATVNWYKEMLGAVCNIAGGRTLGIMENHSDNAYMVFEDREAYERALGLVENAK